MTGIASSRAVTARWIVLLATLAGIPCALSCVGPRRSPLETWNVGEDAPLALGVAVVSSADGALDELSLAGTLHLYRGSGAAATADGTSALPPHRDLKLRISFQATAADLAAPEDLTVSFLFRKLSPRLIGPRLYHDGRLHLWLDDTRFELRTRGKHSSDPEYWDESRAVEVPLGTFVDIARAGSFRGRLGCLSPFAFSAAELAAIDALVSELEVVGIDLDRLARAAGAEGSTIDGASDDEAAGTGGSIWGVRYGEPSSSRSRIVQVSSYSGPPAPIYTLRPTNWIRWPNARGDEPLAARMAGYETDVVPALPAKDDAPVQRAWEIAGLAAATIQDELGLARRPDLSVFLFPIVTEQACRIVLQTPIERGVAFGVPEVDGRIFDKHASTLLWLATHETTEGCLILPYFGPRCALYRSSRNTRWVGDGIAELVAAIAHERARAEGRSLPAPGDDLDWLLDEWDGGVRAVRLDDWLTIRPPAVGDSDPSTATKTPEISDKTRYLAAEYLCHRWYESARERGHRRPIAALVEWLSGFPAGPTYPELVGRMARLGGFDVAQAARAVPLQAALQYHAEKWQRLGWEAGTLGPTRAAAPSPPAPGASSAAHRRR